MALNYPQEKNWTQNIEIQYTYLSTHIYTYLFY